MSGELEAAIEAARAAGEVLRRNFNTGVVVRYKGLVDLVTQVDEEAERIITDMLRAAYPTYGFLAEESGASAGQEDVRWIVDPLDGTTNYAHSLPFFAVSIALQKQGELTAGVVYDPLRDELFAAARGEGAACNGVPLKVSVTDDLLRALVVTGFPYDREKVPAALDTWGRFTLRAQGMRRTGAAALDMCYVAAGRFDVYYERGIWAWDIAAGTLILHEAGGRTSSYAGGELDLEAREIVDTNGVLHEQALSVLHGDVPGA